jgi:ribonuclease HII
VPNLGIWKGDQVCGCVAAAGVLAKVTRDRIMVELDSEYPQYGFAEHKGYVTAAHRATLAEFGPSPVHRQCFAPVRNAGMPDQVPSSTNQTADQEGAA